MKILHVLIPALLVTAAPAVLMAQEATKGSAAKPAAETTAPAKPAQSETAPAKPAQSEEEIQSRLKDTSDPESTRYEAAKKPYVKTRLSETEIVEFVDAVKTYVYGKPPSKDTLKVFDRTKLDTVVLKYVGLVRDPDCHRVLGNGFVAVCGEMKNEETGDDYILAFICRRKSDREERVSRYDGDSVMRLDRPLDQVTVRDVFVKSINGVAQNEVYLDEDGMWHAKPAEKPKS